MNLCDYNTIRDLLARHGFHFSKSMGQNFLIDPEVPRRIDQKVLSHGFGEMEPMPGQQVPDGVVVTEIHT